MLKCVRCQFIGNSDVIKNSPKSIPKWYGKPVCKKCFVELKEETMLRKKKVVFEYLDSKEIVIITLVFVYALIIIYLNL